jgi:Mg2+/citrate symporter
MLSLMGFLTIGVILALLLTNRVAAVVALAGVPILGGLIAGFSRPRSVISSPTVLAASSVSPRCSCSRLSTSE